MEPDESRFPQRIFGIVEGYFKLSNSLEHFRSVSSDFFKINEMPNFSATNGLLRIGNYCAGRWPNGF
jgi:hypothetical protein